MGFRSNRKGLAIVAAFLFLMGVVVPAAFGLLTEKAMELGVGDLLDKSTNWDSTNIANSTYFTNEIANFLDNETGQKYSLSLVYDSSQDMDLMMATTDSVVSSITTTRDQLWYSAYFNKSSLLDNVDKIVVLIHIADPAQADLSTAKIKVNLIPEPGQTSVFYNEYNATDAYNATLKVEIPIDAVKRLKLEQGSGPYVWVIFDAMSATNELNNVVWGVKVELYDVKKVNASAAANIMLAVSGILGWVGALAATPYWNPYSNREHRNVRRVYRKVRSFRRRR